MEDVKFALKTTSSMHSPTLKGSSLEEAVFWTAIKSFSGFQAIQKFEVFKFKPQVVLINFAYIVFTASEADKPNA